MPTDEHYMQQAIELAKQGIYSTQPNPHVGCVIVKDGQVIGTGAHLKAGTAHAEIHALNQAGKQANDATAYVTLEPCSHIGRTGACSQALIDAGIKRVVVASTDPNPKVAGKGLRMLEDAGVSVKLGCLEENAKALNVGFLARFNTGKPYVCAKLAMSLDGRTAMASGESKWITGVAAREDVQRLRAQSCAVISTAKSVIADNAAMNVRFCEANIQLDSSLQRQPLRVLMDSQLAVDINSRFMQQAGDILVVTKQPNTQPLVREASLGRLDYLYAPNNDLDALLLELAQREINQVLVEAGPIFTGALIKQGLVDELVVYCAPTMMGNLAKPLIELPLHTMNEKINWQFKQVQQVGDDLKLRLVPAA